jgi:hypothetical protein
VFLGISLFWLELRGLGTPFAGAGREMKTANSQNPLRLA